MLLMLLISTLVVKPYTNAVLTAKQRYFNYRLSSARMVTEGAYGQLEGRWSVLLRRNESGPHEVKTSWYYIISALKKEIQFTGI